LSRRESQFLLELGSFGRHVAGAHDEIMRLFGDELNEELPVMVEERAPLPEMCVGDLDDAELAGRTGHVGASQL
jgi:hypothetical protein